LYTHSSATTARIKPCRHLCGANFAPYGEGREIEEGGGIQCPHLLTFQKMKKQEKGMRGNEMTGMEEKWTGKGIWITV
jgi:hypothetical protein